MAPQQAWDVSGRSQSDLYWESHFRDLLETSQKRWCYVTSWRRLKYISQKMFFLWRLQESQKHLKKDVFCGTSLRRLENISKNMSFPWRLWGDTIQLHLSQVFAVFRKYFPGWHGCISDASLRRFIQRLRHISKRADLGMSEASPRRVTKDVSLETALISLKFSQRLLRVASKTFILGIQTKILFI